MPFMSHGRHPACRCSVLNAKLKSESAIQTVAIGIGSEKLTAEITKTAEKKLHACRGECLIRESRISLLFGLCVLCGEKSLVVSEG